MREKILIIGNKLIGDTIATVPSIRQIQEAHSQSTIEVFSPLYTKDIYAIIGLPVIDELSHLYLYIHQFKIFYQILSAIKKKKYQKVFIYPGGFIFAFFGLLG